MTNEEGETLWEIEETRSSPSSYVLNSKDRKYCKTGNDQNTLTKGALRRRIKNERLRKMPLRFQDLFDDIALIEYAETEFLNSEEEANLWQELIDVQNRSETTLGFEVAVTADSDRDDQVQFGLELGAVLRNLANSIDSGLLWGLMLGLYGLPPELHEKETNQFDRILSNLEKNMGLLPNSVKQREYHSIPLNASVCEQ